MTKGKLLNLMTTINAVILLVCSIFAFIYKHTTKGNLLIMISGLGIIIVFIIFDKMTLQLKFSEQKLASEEVESIAVLTFIIYMFVVFIFGT